jgi:hypothetical protein
MRRWRGPEEVECEGGEENARRITGGGGQHERSRRREMIWVAWFTLALESLVIAPSLWIMWVLISEASRAPDDLLSPEERPPDRLPARSLEHPQEANHEDLSLREDPPLFDLEEADERGYVSSRKLRMGCEAAVCRAPFGARIVAGRRSLREPQYAWDYAGVRVAEKALVHAGFDTHPRDGIVGVDEFERVSYPAAEPQGYFRRWRYTAEGQMERF